MPGQAERAERFRGRGLAYLSVGSGICNQCRHVSDDGQSCKAFPHGIARRILTGEIDHRKPVSGDHGIQFEAREA